MLVLGLGYSYFFLVSLFNIVHIRSSILVVSYGGQGCGGRSGKLETYDPKGALKILTTLLTNLVDSVVGGKRDCGKMLTTSILQPQLNSNVPLIALVANSPLC